MGFHVQSSVAIKCDLHPEWGTCRVTNHCGVCSPRRQVMGFVNIVALRFLCSGNVPGFFTAREILVLRVSSLLLIRRPSGNGLIMVAWVKLTSWLKSACQFFVLTKMTYIKWGLTSAMERCISTTWLVDKRA